MTVSPAGPGRKGIMNRGMDFWRRRSPGADDSGIDSDEEIRASRNLFLVNDFMQVSDSSSDDDGLRFPFRMPTVRVNHKGRTIDNGSDVSEGPDDGPDERYEGPVRKVYNDCTCESDHERLDFRKGYNDRDRNRDCDSDRDRFNLAFCAGAGDPAGGDLGPGPKERPEEDAVSENGNDSPSLLEVELTASDEDDDGSVLELVIPLQQSMRYQRVATSKPKPSKRRAWAFSLALWCCVRKRSE